MTEQQYQAVIRGLEDELQQLRGLRARTAAFINNPAHDHHTRRALAEHLGLPAPRQESPTHG
ncbi:hypothetical protein [Streptomyces capuensis]|uniref:hypothetical protein n=1 Tax=Streptomyces capuensis TaxID=1464056 RepID=UPI0004C14BD8|nr:hypothetical protein [Streptomyces capuensis]